MTENWRYDLLNNKAQNLHYFPTVKKGSISYRRKDLRYKCFELAPLGRSGMEVIEEKPDQKCKEQNHVGQLNHCQKKTCAFVRAHPCRLFNAIPIFSMSIQSTSLASYPPLPHSHSLSSAGQYDIPYSRFPCSSSSQNHWCSTVRPLCNVNSSGTLT